MRVRMPVLADLEREADGAGVPGLGEQALDGELEVVDLLEGEVHALGDAADDQAHDGLEVARQRRLEVDPLSTVTRSRDRALAHDAIAAHQAGQLPGRHRARRARRAPARARRRR